jgi:hypothetical protein
MKDRGRRGGATHCQEAEVVLHKLIKDTCPFHLLPSWGSRLTGKLAHGAASLWGS